MIDENGQMLGVKPTEEALRITRDRGYDLVLVVPNADPPVARMLDYGQFKYEQEKKARKAKSQAKKVEVKGLRLSLKIGQHDREVRMKKAIEFLEEGNKVKIEIVLRGRENQRTPLAKEIMRQFFNDLNARMPAVMEQDITKMGGRLSMLVAPQKTQ